jgi:hypothetical protein
MIPLQEQADPEGAILTLSADLQDQGDDVGGRREGVVTSWRYRSRQMWKRLREISKNREV